MARSNSVPAPSGRARPSATARPSALAATRPPRWRPTTVGSMPNRSQSWSVCAKSRAVTSTSWPRARSSSITGRRTSTCGLFVRSIQTRISVRPWVRSHSVGERPLGARRLDRGDDLDGLRRLSTGLIGIARWVAAASSVPGSGAPAGYRRIAGCAVDRRAVVGARADPHAFERGAERLGVRMADHVEVPGRVGALHRARQRRRARRGPRPRSAARPCGGRRTSRRARAAARAAGRPGARRGASCSRPRS